MKKLIFVISLFAIAALAVEPASADIAQDGVKVIVLDAGHGGNDSGAASGRVYEKDITLKLVLKVGALIESRMPGVKVVYTRKTDKYLALSERASIAHAAKGDLYISIHVNAASKSAKGAETCIFSMDQSLIAVNRGNGDKDMDRAADRNRNMLLNRHNEELVDLSKISNDAATTAYINRLQFELGEYSNALAELIQRNYAKSGRVVRGVKRGPFMVLWGIEMPSVLTEVGFLSHPDELKYMTSEKGQSQIAEDIYRAVSEYVGNINKALQKEKRGVANVPEVEEPDPVSAPVVAPVEETKTQPKSEPEQKKNNAGEPTRGFTVQIMASTVELSLNDSRFKSYRGKVKCYFSDGSYKYKYCTGFYTTRSEAQSAANKLQKEFKGAFVIEVEGDKVVKK